MGDEAEVEDDDDSNCIGGGGGGGGGGLELDGLRSALSKSKNTMLAHLSIF